MKIVIDLRMFKYSGVGRYIRNILPHIISNENKNEFIFIAHKEDIENYPYLEEYKIIYTKISIFSIFQHIELLFLVPLCDSFWSPHFIMPFILPQARKKYVTIHDIFPLTELKNYNFLKKLYVSLLFKNAAKKSTKIFTVSEFSKKEISRYLNVSGNKIINTFCGIKKSFSNIEQLKNIDENFILYVGNVKPHKNLHRALEAFSKISKNFPSLKFYIVGKKDGFYTATSNLMENYSFLEDRIIFTGIISDDELKNYYQSAKMLLFPSLYEGFGLPPLEAMCFNIPIVCSNVASLPEVCGDAVLYFNPLDVNDIADKICMVLKNEWTVDKNKYLKQINKFSWESISDIIKKVLIYEK